MRTYLICLYFPIGILVASIMYSVDFTSFGYDKPSIGGKFLMSVILWPLLVLLYGLFGLFWFTGFIVEKVFGK